MRSLDTISADSSVSFSNYTLLFQTLKARVWMSAYDPLGRAKEYTTHVHLYDESFRYLGVSWVNDITFWAQAGYFAKGTPKLPNWRKFPVDIALLSGPERPTVMTQQTYVWPETIQEGEPIPDSAKFYRVILLSRWSISDYKPLHETYERVGLGEVRADFVENWDKLKWEDILLQ